MDSWTPTDSQSFYRPCTVWDCCLKCPIFFFSFWRVDPQCPLCITRSIFSWRSLCSWLHPWMSKALGGVFLDQFFWGRLVLTRSEVGTVKKNGAALYISQHFFFLKSINSKVKAARMLPVPAPPQVKVWSAVWCDFFIFFQVGKLIL